MTRFGVYLAFIFFCHMIACAAAMLVLCAYVLQTRRVRLLLAMLSALALACWYEVALRLHPLSMSSSEGPARWGSLGFLVYKANSLLKAIGCVNLLETTRGASISLKLLGPAGFVLMLAMYVLFLAALVTVIAGGWKRQAPLKPFEGSYRLRFLWVCVAVLGLVGLLLPAMTLNAINPGYRCLQLAIVLSSFLVVPTLAKGWMLLPRIVAVCAVLSCLLNLFQFAVIQIDPFIAGTVPSNALGRVALQATWTKPMYKWVYYESLQSHRPDMDIFNTGLYESAEPAKMVKPPR